MVWERNAHAASVNEGLVLYLKWSPCMLLHLTIVYRGLHWLLVTCCLRDFKVTIVFPPFEMRHSWRSGDGWTGWLIQLLQLRVFLCISVAEGSEECCDNSDKRLIKGPICALAATDGLHKSPSIRLPTNKLHVNFLQRWYARRQWEEENNGCEFKLPSLQSTQPKRISNSSSMQARGGRAVQWHHLCVILHRLAYSPTVFLG